MAQFIISVMSQDRTGIVADVTSAIRHLNGNLEDMSQTVLRGYFTMILLAEFPPEIDETTLKTAFADARPLEGFSIGITPYQATSAVNAAPNSDNLYVLTSSGPDRTGIVNTVAEYLREKNINIVDLTSRSKDGKYSMMFLLELPAGTDVGKLKHSLRIAMEDYDLTVELRHQALFRKTNEI